MTPRHWLGFLLFCLLWASSWLVDSAWPSLLPSTLRVALGTLVVGAIATACDWRDLAAYKRQRWLKVAIAGIGLIGVPALLVPLAHAAVSSAMSTALFALVPVMAVILEPYLGHGVEQNTLLAPSLVGLTGVLLLLPFALPGSPRQGAYEMVVVAAALVSASSGIWLHRLAAGPPLLKLIAVCCLANAVFLLVAGTLPGMDFLPTQGFQWGSSTVVVHELATALFFQAPQIVLLLWLVREISPIRLATRYLVVPLLIVLEGYLFVEASFSWRSVAGLLLLVAGISRLMAAPADDPESRLILR